MDTIQQNAFQYNAMHKFATVLDMYEARNVGL